MHDHVMLSDDAEIKCPHQDENYACGAVISEREIREVCMSAERNLIKNVDYSPCVLVRETETSNTRNSPLEGAMQLKQAPLDFSFRMAYVSQLFLDLQK